MTMSLQALLRTVRRPIIVGILAVGFGAVLRIILLAQRAPLWGDEAMLAVGVLRTGVVDVFRPLDYLQIAPPLYLLLAKVLALILGHSEWILRLPAFAAGTLTLYLIYHVARETSGWETALTAALLAGLSAVLLRYSAEVKPYAFDALFGIAIPYIVLRLSREDCRSPRCLIGLWLAAMVAGSVAAPVLVGALIISIAAVPEARRSVGWTTLVGSAIVAGVGYLALYFGVYHANASSAPMVGFWSESFLAIRRPGAFDRFRLALQALASLLPSLAPLAREYRTLLVVLGGALLLPRRSGLRLALAAPTVLAIGFSAFGLFPLAPRLLLFALPGLILSAAEILVALVPKAHADNRRVYIALAVLCAASISSLAVLPFPATLSRLLLAALVAAVLVPRLAPAFRAVVPACLGVLVAAPQGIAEIRNPTIEDGRTTIAAILDRHAPAIYIPAASAATWVYYSSPWTRRDRPRVDWYVAQASIDGAAIPFSDDPSAEPVRTAAIWHQPGRLEILGTWPGVVYRPPRGFITGPRPGWAVSEVRRVNEEVGSDLVIVETHALPGATEALLTAFLATCWYVDSTRREETASAIFLHRDITSDARDAHIPALKVGW